MYRVIYEMRKKSRQKLLCENMTLTHILVEINTIIRTSIIKRLTKNQFTAQI